MPRRIPADSALVCVWSAGMSFIEQMAYFH